MSATSGRLRIEQLSAWYGQARGLHDVSLHAAPGEIVGILGRNGAGKSTLLRTVARLHRRATGVIALDGENLMGLSGDVVAARGVSMVREGAKVFEDLSVWEHLQLARRLGEMRGADVDVSRVTDWFPVLWNRRGMKGGYLSGGQRQMLGLAMAFLARPTVLLLDEPSAGLAESVAESVYESIRSAAGRNLTIVIAEQDSRWLGGLVQRAYVLESGAVVDEVAGEHVAGVALDWSGVE